MVNYGIFSKTPNADNKLKIDYELTARGKELEPILMALGKWGYKNIEKSNDVKAHLKRLKLHK